ncbi:hypothetical protein [Geodermatophilus sp. FMUSA9-8]|uniref:hypothetical protein n=1 Tax=Geodermatophilus sp. FMUSA9-8 TaxID=3120155 RepID=UPI003008D2F9
MRTVRVLVVAGTAGLLALAPGVAAAAPGGCKAFGQNVAGLAQTLGPAFGATASTVATSGPGAFPTLVVHPEQQALCSDAG